jgi:cation:H+ antiporter
MVVKGEGQMVWVKFIFSAVVIVLAANQLAKYGDIIAVRTKLGGMFIGILLLAGATSLPELLTSANAIQQGTPNLAAGNLLGSNSFNMLLLALIDILFRNKRILRNAALKHALSGSLAILMIGLVLYFMLAKIQISIGWVGIDSLVIIAFYVLAVRLIQKSSPAPENQNPEAGDDNKKGSLVKGIIGFVLAASVLVFITPLMVRSANEIADITGLGTTFIGTTLVAIVTSLPELVTTLAAVKIGAEDMAIGNLFGSNMFNMFAIGLTDIFYTEGNFLSAIGPEFLLVAITGLVMTGFGLIGNLAKLEKRIWFIELDALALVLFYILSTWLLYARS